MSIDVFDVAGSHVRSLLVGKPMSAGNHRVAWEGRRDDGRSLPAGVYFVRMRAAGIDRATAVTLLK